MPRAVPWLLLVVAVPLLCGCRNDMYDQPKYNPLSPGSHLIGETSALQPPEGTISRSMRPTIETIDTGMAGGKLAVDLPIPLTKALLERGRDRYGIFCTPCHGVTGDGRGMIVLRGFSPPPSLYSPELREAPIGHFYDVITRGHGAMYSYASRVEVNDRWAIAAFIRALQLSQDADAKSLPEADRARLVDAPKADPDTGNPTQEEGRK